MFIFAAMAMVASSAVVADASRAPSKKERGAIKRAAMRYCEPQEQSGYECVWKGHIRVSTRNSRFAYARVSGPAYDSSGILKRRTRNSRHWRMVRVVGGGIQPCAYWYSAAPKAVVHEFKIRGFTQGDQTFRYHRC